MVNYFESRGWIETIISILPIFPLGVTYVLPHTRIEGQDKVILNIPRNFKKIYLKSFRPRLKVNLFTKLYLFIHHKC